MPEPWPLPKWRSACKGDGTGFVSHSLSTVTRPVLNHPQAHQAAVGFPPPSLEGALTQPCCFLSIDHCKHPHWVLVTLNSTQRGSPRSTNSLRAHTFLTPWGMHPSLRPLQKLSTVSCGRQHQQKTICSFLSPSLPGEAFLTGNSGG